MAVVETPTAAAAPRSLERLAERFDRASLDPVEEGSRARLHVTGRGAWDAVVDRKRLHLGPADDRERPDAELTADAATWGRVASELRSAMAAFLAGRLSVRRNLHLGVGLLAATSANEEPGRLRFRAVNTRAGQVAVAEAGTGEPVICLHGLGGTKGSFLPTLSALAGDEFRVIAVDFPGFGDSYKPIGAPYDAPYLAETVIDLLDALKLDRAHLIGNSMGGRVALEMGFSHPDRTDKLVLLAPAMAWLRGRPWAGLLRLVRPELIRFERHVKRVLPDARHLELPCGHVPQVEAPRETHRAVRKFLLER